jgi:hypothetical protein
MLDVFYDLEVEGIAFFRLSLNGVPPWVVEETSGSKLSARGVNSNRADFETENQLPE